MRTGILVLTLVFLAACSREPAPAARSVFPSAPRHVLVITIDTLRADHVGAYGYRAARTPAIDRLARDGVRFDHAYATAPITLTSHASVLTGRYPPGHGARHNGLRIDMTTPTLAEAFARAGFDTGGFVAAFPLDRRFGLIKGFQEYGDQMPRDARGHLLNDRPGQAVVDEALAWLAPRRTRRTFLWVHLFEPHAPYGDPSHPAQAARPAIDRYDDDVAEADRQVGRLLDGLGPERGETLILLAADHGEAFGEHGEISHSLFAYDTTLRVPLIIAGPQAAAGTTVSDPVALVDVAPTIASLAGLGPFDADGRVILPPKGGSHRGPGEPKGGSSASLGERVLYAESFAPLLDFGWSPLRTVRSGGWKFVAAPTLELYDLTRDPGETRNLAGEQPARVADLARQVDAMAPAALASSVGSGKPDPESRARLQALGYLSGRPEDARNRPDPKDRRDLAARLAQVASGELRDAALDRALREILRADPENPQANVRLGYVLLNSGRCADAIPRFSAAIAAKLPSADAHLGRAACETAARHLDQAARTLSEAQRVEPDNPVVSANLGLVLSDSGRPDAGIPHLQRALGLDPGLDQARFGLALAYARTNRRKEAAEEAQELLRRLPPTAAQRSEVERLLAAVR